jgi:hypothetical protein
MTSPLDKVQRQAAVATAIAFAPFPYCVLAGQASALALGAITLADAGLRRESKLATGAAIGLLGYKVSLLVPAAGVCFIAGEWLIVGAAIAVAALQTFIVLPFAGWAVLERSFVHALGAARRADSLAMHPYLMFSWRTFWASLLPRIPALTAYGVCSMATILFAAWRWRACGNARRRIGLLSIATVLASPHVFLYDLVILIPAFLAAVEALWIDRSRGLYAVTCVAYLASFTVLIGAYTHVQIGTVFLCAWLVMLGMQRCTPAIFMNQENRKTQARAAESQTVAPPL